tara:strand:+ start:1770 stop:2264 length:495 start_codon:yes stop_codon:yes gene_type:complete
MERAYLTLIPVDRNQKMTAYRKDRKAMRHLQKDLSKFDFISTSHISSNGKGLGVEVFHEDFNGLLDVVRVLNTIPSVGKIIPIYPDGNANANNMASVILTVAPMATKNVLKDLVSQDELYGFQKENSTKIYADIRTNGTSVKKKLLEEICLIAGITDIAVTQIS